MRGRRVLYITYGVYSFAHEGSTGIATGDDATDDQLIHPDLGDQGGFTVMTGTFDGPVEVTVETCDRPPEESDDGWEHVEDRDLVSKGLNLVSGTLTEQVAEFPRLFVNPGDRYHVRLYARGVDAARELQEIDLDDGPVEHHLVQLWRDDA